MNRRGFIRSLHQVLGVGAIVGLPAARVLRRLVAVPYTAAVRSRTYPGRLKNLEQSVISKIGKWAG